MLIVQNSKDNKNDRDEEEDKDNVATTANEEND